MSKAPVWATKLIDRVEKDFGRPVVTTLVWRKSRPRRRTYTGIRSVDGRPEIYQRTVVMPVSTSSSGRAYPGLGRLVVTAGKDTVDQRVVLLHELAHLMVGPGHAHDDVFWLQAMKNLKKYLPKAHHPYAVTRETAYRQGAAKAARKLRMAA